MLSEVNASLYSKPVKSKLNILLNALIAIIVVVIAFELIFGATYSGIYVVGSSMSPTLDGAEEFSSGDGNWSIADTSGDYVYVNKNAKPKYGDIVVVFKKQLNSGEKTIIKRVIGLGGDYVRLISGQLQIKYKGTDEFTDVREDYVSPDNNTPALAKNTFPRDRNNNLIEEGYFVEEGYMFLLGDNRDASSDSRANGGTSFAIGDLYGVVTDWSLKHVKFFTALHKYFYFDLPACFGIDKRIKRRI